MRRLLIIGCGDVALRVAPQLRDRYRLYALTHSLERVPLLRAHGVVPITGDLDDAASLDALAGIAHDVLHCAPPPHRGTRDTRTAHLIAALTKGKSLPQQLVYISTSGVYGDCEGAFVDETRVPRPPGTYSEARLPLAQLQAGTPALRAAEDAYTNHIHAADRARAAVAALRFAHSGRAYNAADDSVLKMGDYFDLVADRFGLPRPQRISRAEAGQRIAPDLLSFMNESRRLSNRRIKQELRLKLHYPTVREGVAAQPPRRA